ncbi:hypothetical protein, partial [Streptomyces sp. NPDC055607]
AAAEADLKKAGDLVASTTYRLDRYCTPTDLNRIDLDRQEADLLIRSAAVWAQLAAAAPLLGPAARSGKSVPATEGDLTLEDTSGERGGPNPLAWP